MAELASAAPGYWSLRRYTESSGEQHEYLVFNCPCGCRYGDCVPLIRGPHDPKRHEWGWNGSVERPTLSPSLRRNTPCKFHGHLVNGVWSRQPDGSPLAANVYRAGMQPAPEIHETRAGDPA